MGGMIGGDLGKNLFGSTFEDDKVALDRKKFIADQKAEEERKKLEQQQKEYT